MARKPSPWYWPERRGWYTILNGQRHHLLDLAPDDPEPNKRGGKWIVPQNVDQEFHKLMAKPVEAVTASPQEPDGLTIAEVFDKYLDWLKTRTAEGSKAVSTYEWYQERLQRFMNHAGAELLSKHWSGLKPFHVIEWTDSHGDAWSPAYRRGAIIAIQRPFNWAEKIGHIPASPIKHIEKPTAQRREQYITPATWAKIRDHYDDGDPFRDLLEFSWESGCRPQESKAVEARHVDLERHRVVFPPAEAKGKKRWRIIRLTPKAEDVIKRLLEKHPDGILFRNEDDNPWTAYAVACRFGRLKEHLGEKFCATAFRHGVAQDMLENDADPLTVAEILGHANGQMLATVYSHMNKADGHLDKVLKRRAERNQDGIDK